MKKNIAKLGIFKNPRYRRKHVIHAGGKLFTARTGEEAAKILKKLQKTQPNTIPEVAYIPKTLTLIV